VEDNTKSAASDENAKMEKDPKSLSGGEKSYSTICLLLSLWASMRNPFRALDEFDVFMVLDLIMTLGCCESPY
jgi:chromosome segregation ATPase